MKKFVLTFFAFCALTMFSSCDLLNDEEESPTPTTCTVTLYANGGTMTNGDTNSSEKKTYTVSYKSTRVLEAADDLGLSYSDHLFLGWAESKDSSDAKYYAGDLVQINSNVTLYAVWKEIGTAIYYISAVGNDSSGSGTAAKPYATLGKAVENINSKYNDYIFYVSGATESEGVSFSDSVYSTIEANSITVAGLTDSTTDSISLSSSASSSLLLISTSVPVTIKNLTLSGGKGTELANNTLGGSIYISLTSTKEKPTVTIDSVTFSENSASFGGALYNGNGIVSITDCSFSRNASESSGGAIYNEGTMTYSGTASENTGTNGAAVYNMGTLTITSGTIKENVASGYGGAIYNRGTLSIAECDMQSNAAQFGGGIAIVGEKAALYFDYGTVSQNTAEKGGGIYIEEGSCTFTADSKSGSVHVLDNTARAYGGGVYLKSGSLTVNAGVISAWGNRKTTSSNGTVTYTYSGNKAGSNKSLDDETETYKDAGNAWFSEKIYSVSTIDKPYIVGVNFPLNGAICFYSDDDVVVGVDDWSEIAY